MQQQDADDAYSNSPAALAGGKRSSSRQNAEVYVIANSRNNSLIVSAPPQKMGYRGCRFIQRIDVPNASAQDFQRMQSRMKCIDWLRSTPSNWSRL